MTTYKRIDGDYYIQTIDPPMQKVYIDTDTTVTGNLTVQGNLTYINVDELNIRDPFILLNASNTGSYASNSGVLTHETESVFAGIRYNATAGQWELNDGSTDATGLTGTWNPIDSGGAGVPGAPFTSIQFNSSGAFAGNAALTFDAANAAVVLEGHQIFGNIATAPAAVANAVALYHNAEGAGGTGLYARTSASNGELIEKTKSIVFSLIF
jgi:hypothetical protein